MKQDMFKQTDIKTFIIPFAILFIIFAVATFMSIRSYTKKTYDTIEEYSIGLADSYTRRISNSRAATKIITALVEEKQLAVGEIVLQFAGEIEAADLSQLAEKYAVDEINIYNGSGEIINSSSTNLLGQKAYEGHPARLLLSSAQHAYTEETRLNTVSGVSYKYAYVKADDGSVAQIGILSERVDSFLDSFDIQRLIEEFTKNESVENIFFTDDEYRLVATGTPDFAGITFDDEEIHDHFMSDKPKVGKEFANKGLLHVCAPVFFDGEKLGTLTVVWSSEIISTEINRIINDNVFRFLITSVLLGGVLLYAFQKRKLSIEVAFYDRLTGLPNDNYLEEYLPPIIRDCGQNKAAILMLNLSNFNLINLTHGFEYGDIVLKQAVAIYANYLSPVDALFRLEADKFVIVVNDYGDVFELEELSQQILADFNNPAINACRHEYLSLKIAIYELYDPSFSVGRVLHDASLGLDALKNNVSADYILFTHSMRKALQREEAIENALLEIIAGKGKERLYLHYQPLLGVKEGRVIGFEALARMNIPGVGEIPPTEFINIAERRNLIFSLGNIIIEKALKFLKALKDATFHNTFVAVNISGLQLLRSEFVDIVAELTHLCVEDYQDLVFEITESVLVENFKIANKNLQELRRLGISIALDDFGTGYSSLAELRNIDIDILKIDRAFIDKIIENDPLITQDIIAMAHRLNLKVVAEGVESKRQIDYLTKHGCDIIQGYYVSKPLPEEGAIGFLKCYNVLRQE